MGLRGSQDLRRRGATHIALIVIDGHDGLIAAVSELFTATPRQRCLVHKQRNVLNAIPRRERDEVQAELTGIWEQPTKQEALTQLAAFKAKYAQRYPEAMRSLTEDEEHLLTFYAFPQSMHRHIQTTNAIESLFSNVGHLRYSADTYEVRGADRPYFDGSDEYVSYRVCRGIEAATKLSF